MIYELKRSMCFPVWTCRLLQENAHPSWGLALLAVRTAPVLVSLTSVNFSPFISSWHCTQQTRLALPQSSHPIQERKQASRVLFGSERVWGSWQGYSYHVAEHRDWLKYPPHLHPQPPPPEYTKPEVFRGDASRNENKVKWESQERKKANERLHRAWWGWRQERSYWSLLTSAKGCSLRVGMGYYRNRVVERKWNRTRKAYGGGWLSGRCTGVYLRRPDQGRGSGTLGWALWVGLRAGRAPWVGVPTGSSW